MIEVVQLTEYREIAVALHPIDGGKSHPLVRANLIAKEQERSWGDIVLLDLGDGTYFIYARKEVS